jgi:subtilisin family serine protease
MTHPRSPVIDARTLVDGCVGSAEGAGVVAGLLDTSFERGLPDFAGADLSARDFTDGAATAEREHGTYSVAMLVAQGRDRFRGLAPRARLLVAEVVGARGVAPPGKVAEALDWLVASGARIIALPLGQDEEAPVIARAVERAAAAGAWLFVAAGHDGLARALFPARHPAVLAIAGDGRAVPGLVGGGRVEARGGSSVACVVAAALAIRERSSAPRLP